jgi:hypothetical protein
MIENPPKGVCAVWRALFVPRRLRFRRPIGGAEPEQTNQLSDQTGAIYGATRSGGTETDCADGGPGGAKGCGVVFRLAPQ